MIINYKLLKQYLRLILGSLFMCFLSVIQAQPLMTESFNYTPGTLLTGANWTLHATGTPTIAVSSGNLTLPGTLGNNFGNKISLTSSGQDVRRTFTIIPTSTTGQAAYASMVVNVSAAQATGDFFFALGSSDAAQNARIYIRSNGNGYSFGIGKTVAEANYETTVRPFGVNTFLVLKYEAYTGALNDIIRLYVNPALASEPATAAISIAPAIADVYSLSRVFLFQGNISNAPTLEVDAINIGSTWASVTSASFDYGDVPTTYDISKDGVYSPAGHLPLSGFYLGSIAPDVELAPNSVASGADNNGTNGDGTEEDAIDASANQIRKGVPYVLSVPVTSTAGTKYLYGWIDFNNNGKFEVGEFATVSFNSTGTRTQTLTWTGAQTGTIVTGADKLYMRLRLSDRALIDYTTAIGGGADMDERSIGFGAVSVSNPANHPTIPNGEVEDYQIGVVSTFDYGDVPVTFESDKDGNPLPALHAPLNGFSIGTLLDVEATPASVTSPNQNNTAGDNAVEEADEDGITELNSVSRGVEYSINIPVNIPSDLSGTKYLYGWLDLNGDGRFQIGEAATATTTLTGEVQLTLTWNAAQTASIAPGTTQIYSRLRLSNLNLIDFTTIASGGALIDERSVGNGATATNNATNRLEVAFGEVEDYQLPVDLYDFGDVPAGYELNNASVSQPARQIANPLYTIGQTIDNEQTAQSVASGADNNGTNGDGADEDGILTLPVVTKGAAFSFSVPVRTKTASNIIAWVDFNNDGKFQENEAAYTAATVTTRGYQSTPIGSSLLTFWFTGSQTSQIPDGATNLYARVRLTQIAGADNASTTGIDERSIADGVNTGIYTTPVFGEVEDYRFSVGDELYDFGDAPESYEMDKDGTASANFKPARNNPTDALHLGSSFDSELIPASVASGADNNGSNGDGADEDGLSPNQLFIRSGAANSFVVSVTNNTGTPATLYAWIDFNNDGRFQATELTTAAVANGATSATLTFTATQINSIATSTQKLYMRLRLIQPDTGVVIADFTTPVLGGAVVDERAIADGLSTGEYSSVSRGEVEDYQLTIIRDYGDVPVSYENGNPAYHTNSITPELMIGSTVDYELSPASVTAGADNNGANGDGEDEDGISIPQTITAGAPFSIAVPVTATYSGAGKNLYAWIDLNGNGTFEGNEAAAANMPTGIGTHNVILTWNNTNVDTSVLAAGKTYVRFRLSGAALTNENGVNTILIDTRSYGGSNAVGEIEDYQFLVDNKFDYGDAPDEYDTDRFGNLLPARQAPSDILKLGTLVDTETAKQTSADALGDDTNGTDDEDAITVMPVYKNTAYYQRVKVTNNTGSNKRLYGWIDFNNNGKFELSEQAFVNVPSSTDEQTVTLSWTAANTNNIPIGTGNVYMRLRISAYNGNGILGDWTTVSSGGAIMDESSIGDGLAGTANQTLYGTPYIGEIEDYLLPVGSTYDYGDLPDSYDTSRNDVVAPARHAVSQGLFIGNNPADAETAKLTSNDALGDDNNATDDEDGVELSSIYQGGGAGYTARVKVTNFTGAARNLYGWIDFNNDGRFQANEAAAVSVPNNTNGGLVTLTWTNAQSVITGSPSELNMRLRISEGTLTDFTSGVPGGLVDERSLADGLNTGEYAATPVIFNGEVEDHKIPVTSNLDYGDVPLYFEENFIGASVPARHLPNGDLFIGNIVDAEPAAQSVAPGADNNGTNGDGLDEDGISIPLPTLVTGSEYRTLVNVTNNLAAAATLHAWIDMDGNGRFTSDEYTSVSVPANSGAQTMQLTWPLVTYTGTAANTYMRIRLTTAALTDNASTANVDERSIGDGLNTGAYAAYPINGEVEDYFVPVDLDATGGTPQDCDPTDDRLGILDPVQALFHASIVKTASGNWLVFGNSAKGSGIANQNTPAKVESGSNGFNFTGNPLMVTGVSYWTSHHQYMLLTSTGLYVWGQPNGVFTNASTAMTQVALPMGVTPADIQMMDAGRDSSVGALMLLTKSGEIWTYSNTIGHNVQGNGNVPTLGWHQVMLNTSTPLTGMKDVRVAGGAAIATDGNNFYTWGTGVYLGDGQIASSRNYATPMVIPTGVTLPVKQQDLNSSSSVSYYLRDSAGKVFVLGNNSHGNLGLGNTTTATGWLTITQVNEQPEASGVQTDVTKPIKKVIWISVNNHDSANEPTLNLITEEYRNYSAGSDSGSKSGVPSPTSRYIPTAVTTAGGARMLEGKMIYAESGGHISILIKDRNDRYGYVGHTVDGSDGCGGCTNSPKEFNFSGPPSTGPVCGNIAFDYGDLDERYNLGDMASHEIKHSQADNPLKLGSVAADSDDGPQFTITGSGNDALGDDNDDTGDDEDAFPAFPSTPLPVKTAGSSYTLNVPLTNNTGSTAYLYGFIDWNANGIFEPGETVVQEVPASGTAQTVALTWADVSIADCEDEETLRSFVRLRLTTELFADDTDTPADERSFLAAPDGEVEDYYLDWTPDCITYCTQPPAPGDPEGYTKVGISTMKQQLEGWPENIPNGWITLDSKAKGFVISRVAHVGGTDGTPVATDAIQDPKDGMLVYDIQDNCVKLFNGLIWNCIQRSCNE